MTLLILGALIWAGVIPTRQEANTYQIKQNIRENFTITGTATSQAFTIPIQNITGPAIARTIYVYAEFNATNNPYNNIVNIELQLLDIGKVSVEMQKVTSYNDKVFTYASINFYASVTHFYSLSLTVRGANVTGILRGNIIQIIQKS